MPSIVTTLGAQTFSTFSSAASGADYVSRYEPYDDYQSPVTGAIGDANSRPIMFRYLQQYTWGSNLASIDLQIATAASGAGGTQSAAVSGVNDPDWNYVGGGDVGTALAYAAFGRNSANATQTYYYGFQKNNASRLDFNTGASPGTTYNPNNIYFNGVVQDGTGGTTNWAGRVLSGRIGWFHVPNQPTSLTVTSKTASSVTLSWTAPSDNGGMAINGYRIVYSSDGTNWTLYGDATSGSPSGTTTTSETITGLLPNTTYEFRVAALNGVSDRHNGGLASVGSITAGDYTAIREPATSAVQNHVGTNAVITGVSTLLHPKVYNGTSMARSTMKVWNGEAWTYPVVKAYNGSSWTDIT